MTNNTRFAGNIDQSDDDCSDESGINANSRRSSIASKHQRKLGRYNSVAKQQDHLSQIKSAAKRSNTKNRESVNRSERSYSYNDAGSSQGGDIIFAQAASTFNNQR